MIGRTVRLALLVMSAIAALPVARAAAQPAPAFPNPAVTLDGKGITIQGTDSVTRLNLRFRMQELMSVTDRDDDETGRPSQVNMMVRRARLRLEGTLRDPRLRVNVQLSFARLDMDQEATGFANVLRDAYITWQATPTFAIAAGQAKLPGNRQRQVSSSELQLPDRSLVNARFTVDRDVGVFASWLHDFGTPRLVLRAAVSAGEGRNPMPGDAGLAFTARAELLPFGAFLNGGDYVEGSAGVRQPGTRVAIGVASSRNDGAVRTGGQLGAKLHAPRSMTTHFADVVVKRGGFTLAAEYAHRTANDPVTQLGSDVRYVFTGQGVHVQTSWLLPGTRIEPVARMTWVGAAAPIRGQAGAEDVREAAVGIARYVHGHRIKYQGEVMRTVFRGAGGRGEVGARFGVEVGI